MGVWTVEKLTNGKIIILLKKESTQFASEAYEKLAVLMLGYSNGSVPLTGGKCVLPGLCTVCNLSRRYAELHSLEH